MKNVIILLLLVISTTVNATNYYVSTSGNDAANGLSESTAWKTIAKINATTFSPGDAILFKRGEVWREMLLVPSSGTSGSYLNFSSYGSGANPRILGSIKCNSWTSYSGNVWVSATTVTNPYTVGSYGAEVFFENTNGSVTWGVHQASPSACTSEYNWAFSSGKIYIYSPSDPNTKYSSVEAPQRTNSVNLNDKNYLDFNGIDVFYVAESGFTYKTYPMQLHNGLIIENSKIAYISTKNSEFGYGIDAGYSDMIVRGCEIHNCGRRGISFDIYGSYKLSNVLIENNYFHDGFHTTGLDFGVGSSTSYLTNIDNVTIRRNTFSDPVDGTAYTHQMFFQNYRYATLDATISNIYIYSNIFITPSLMGSAIMIEGIQSIYIYNNTFYNNNNGGSFHIWVNSASNIVKIKNNIFYTNSNITADARGTGIFIKSTQDYSKVDADYNLYYRINNSLEIIEREYSGSYFMTGIALIRSQLGYEKNSPTPADPKFYSTTDLHLQAGSPAIGKGLAIPEVLMDFDGKPFASPMNIGAYSSLTSVVVNNPPVYVSSVIQNSTPSLVELTYNLTLANLVPSATAFSVMVNSVAKTVSNVVIAGTKVQLILASPLLYTDVVKVSYTKPATNPLQTSAGGFAVSISGMAVVNSITTPTKDATAATIKMTLSPNPTHKIINCLFVYSANFSAVAPAMSPQVIKIFNNYGKLYVQKTLTTGIASAGIPINLRSGIYKVVLTSGIVEMSSQKIMVY